MEQLQSSRPWRNKINGSTIKARSDYTEVFSVPPWRTESFSIRLDDYSEIFDSTAFASIPVLELSTVEQGLESFDYLDVFGNGIGGGFSSSCEKIFAELKISSGFSSVGRNRWDVLSERQGKEASEHPLKVDTANNEPILEMKHYSSFSRQSDDINSKNFSMPYHRMSQETIDDDSKIKAFKSRTVNNMDTNGNSPGGQKNKKQNFVSDPPESNFGSLLDVPVDQKPNSQSHTSHSASSDYMLLHDVAYLKVSEINLQTNPFKGPPPSRPPPTLSRKLEHLKIMSADPKVVEEGSSLKSNVSNQLHSSNEAAKTQTIENSIEGISFSHDAEMDPSSAAAVSIAAIKEAIEQAQVRLTSAKKLMDRKRAKLNRKVGLPKAMSEMEDGTADAITPRNCSTGIVANNLLNTNGDCEGKDIRTGVRIHLNHEERNMQLSSNGKDQKQVSKDSTFKSSVEREEIRNTSSKIDVKDEQQVRKENASTSSELACKIDDVAGEWQIDEEYYDLLKNDRFFNTVKDIHIQGDEGKVVICSFVNKENYGNDSEQAVELEHQQKSMEVNVYTEKLAKDNNLKIPCINGVEEGTMNSADAAMDEFLHKDYASELEEDYDSPLSDENQKQSEAHEDKDTANNANKFDSVVGCSLYEDNINEVGSNIFLEPWVANVNREKKELQAAERKLNVSHGKFEVNESNKKVKVQNETFFHDMFKKEIKEWDELFTINTAVERELDDEIKLSNHENETRSMTDQASCRAYKSEIGNGDNAAEKHESDEFQTNEDAQVLVENHIEQEPIQDENRLENGLEMSETQGRVKDAELQNTLNSTEETCRKDCNEKESREFRTSLQNDDELVLPLMNQDLKKSEFLASAEGSCGNRVSENITKLPVLVETQISSNSADEACQLGEIEESDTGKIFLSGKEGSLRATTLGATENSHDEKPGNYKHSLYTEAEGNKIKTNVDGERNGGLETHLEQKNLKREKEREMIAAKRENYEAYQQELAEARLRTERIAVERATAEARKRALEEAQQKAEKAAEVEKASREARLRAERAAVERVTEEARKRAIEKALAEKTAADARKRAAQVGTSKDGLRNDIRTEHFKANSTQEDSAAKYKPNLAKDQRNAQSQTAASSANDHLYSESHSNVGGAESKLSKARQQKQQQTAERAAKAINERNMRDILTQREQAERDRLAESLDGDVRRWSSGKDGNLCILLSTLQHILGPDSGWQPIPLKDIMNATAAKKAYRKATLCVHPDKLQQRGASIQQKYICEKVFDILQEAWNKFNSEGR